MRGSGEGEGKEEGEEEVKDVLNTLGGQRTLQAGLIYRKNAGLGDQYSAVQDHWSPAMMLRSQIQKYISIFFV